MSGYSVLALGCGHMAGAMLRGWRKNHLPITVTVVKPTQISDQVDHYAASLAELQAGATYDVVLLAVPPQVADTAMAGLATYLHGETLVISIMAGKTLAHLSARLNGHDTIVRVMPNMPAQLGQGICGTIASKPLDSVQSARLDALISATGAAVALNNEDEINIVTALSGSGPAYAFLLVKAMTDAGISLGLNKEQAGLLAVHTVAGAGQYALHSNQSPEELLQRIAISGGTTEAALKHLNNDGAFCTLMQEAITKAHSRAEKLG